jgi:hypothetical protein
MKAAYTDVRPKLMYPNLSIRRTSLPHLWLIVLSLGLQRRFDLCLKPADDL